MYTDQVVITRNVINPTNKDVKYAFFAVCPDALGTGKEAIELYVEDMEQTRSSSDERYSGLANIGCGILLKGTIGKKAGKIPAGAIKVKWTGSGFATEESIKDSSYKYILGAAKAWFNKDGIFVVKPTYR